MWLGNNWRTLLSCAAAFIWNIRSSFGCVLFSQQLLFYLEELLLRLLYSIILLDNAAICLISQAAFPPCISLWINGSGQRCYLPRSLTFTEGFSSVQIAVVFQDQFCVWFIEDGHNWDYAYRVRNGWIWLCNTVPRVATERKVIHWTHLLERKKKKRIRD